ncbi:MAG: hypothetical protein EOO65_00410 [Methanosarcinales archaeon]|nr:MAG: hypothetical protein EOO65_00410 [Methanosarcinales archaeon]
MRAERTSLENPQHRSAPDCSIAQHVACKDGSDSESASAIDIETDADKLLFGLHCGSGGDTQLHAPFRSSPDRTSRMEAALVDDH